MIITMTMIMMIMSMKMAMMFDILGGEGEGGDDVDDVDDGHDLAEDDDKDKRKDVRHPGRF